MGQKFPRPDAVNFPAVQNKLDFNFEKCQEMDASRGKQIKLAKSIFSLKSGNILVSYIWRNDLEMKSCLAIYSIPKLKLIEEYEFDNELDGTVYRIDSAIQLKNGNIFAICDRLYIFDGESISKGPKITSDTINNAQCEADTITFADPDDIFKKREIRKEARTFRTDSIFEAKEGIILYTTTNIYTINLLIFANLNTEGKVVYKIIEGIGKNKRNYFDIVCQSEYYPEHLYVCANIEFPADNLESLLLIFNFDEFCEYNKGPKKPLEKIQVSGSQNIFALCEYDKKFLLLDTIGNGIYIIDTELKQKVAVSVLKLFLEGESKLTNFMYNYNFGENKKVKKKRGNSFQALYRKMIKLKDGRVLTLSEFGGFYIADIREQKKVPVNGGNSALFAVSGNFIITLYKDTKLQVFRLYDD